MTLAVPVSEGVVYYLRVLPATTTYTDTGTAVWASSARTYPLQVAATSPVDTTPIWMTATVNNGVPLDPVDFYVDGGATLMSAVLDESGQVVNTSIPLPILTAGSHTLTAATPTQSGTATFVVTNASTSYPDAPGADTDPVAVAQTGVVKWVLQLPASNYLFEINPSKMSSPHSARVFTIEHSTAPDGQPLTFEGAPIGVDWTIEGTVLTQEFHDALDDALAYSARVYLIDHLSRAWTVTLESINWTRLPQAYNDWAFTYQLKTIIYAGPEQL